MNATPPMSQTNADTSNVRSRLSLFGGVWIHVGCSWTNLELLDYQGGEEMKGNCEAMHGRGEEVITCYLSRDKQLQNVVIGCYGVGNILQNVSIQFFSATKCFHRPFLAKSVAGRKLHSFVNGEFNLFQSCNLVCIWRRMLSNNRPKARGGSFLLCFCFCYVLPLEW